MDNTFDVEEDGYDMGYDEGYKAGYADAVQTIAEWKTVVERAVFGTNESEVDG